MRNANDGALDSFSDGAVTCEWLFAGLVIAGVLGEFAIAAHHPPYDSWLGQWGSAYADLMVAVGVAGEVLAGVLAHIVQGELTRRSDERVAQLEFETAFAKEGAARAEQQAAEARERAAEIERLTAGRHLSKEQRERIAQSMRAQASEIDLLVEFQQSDSEALVYAMEFCAAFRMAGITKIRRVGNEYLSGAVFGVHIAARDDIDLSPLLKVFEGCDPPVLNPFKADLETHLPRNETPPNVYVFVAPKPAPEIAAAMKRIADPKT